MTISMILLSLALALGGALYGTVRALLSARADIQRLQAPPPAAPGQFDQARLLAALRENDPRALDAAYLRTFSGPEGRTVLAHHMASMGVGNALGFGLSDGERNYQAGRHDAAIELMSRAGFDQAASILAVFTDNLEGSDYDRPSQRDLDGHVTAGDELAEFD